MYGLLNHRATLLRLSMLNDDGVPDMSWQPIERGLRCRLDTSITMIKDATWKQEGAGRAPDKIGSIYIGTAVQIFANDRFQMTLGPSGVFEVITVPDEVPTAGYRISHQVCFVRQVADAFVGGER